VEKAQPAHGENSSATSTGQPRPAWRVGIAATDRRAGHTEHYSVTGDHVVLAAGTLGTNEILMRAADRGLSLSDRLGHGFSANGDDMVFAAELDTPVNAVATGYPSQAPSDTPAVGPHSMAIVDLGDDTAPVWVHDGTMLSVMARIAPFKELAGLGLLRAARMFAGGPWRGELSRTQVYYLVSHDSGEGRIRYARDRVHVDWPEFSTDAQRLHVEKKARDMIEGMGARFKSNPFVLRAFGGNRVIAHPLGGAGLAETAADGVVAPDGQVFNPAEGRAAVHDGLYVADGAAVPTAIGVSPLLTITALAERMSGLAAARLGRSLDLDAATPWPADFKPHAAA
ncbi:MAG: GMC oxidoreductase, partial [Pseudomonadota bacterium]